MVTTAALVARQRHLLSTNFYGNSAFRCSSHQHASLRRVKQRPPIWDNLKHSSSGTLTSRLSSLTFTRPSANSPSTRRCDCVILQRHPDSMLQTQHADRDIKLDRANKLVSPTWTSQTTSVSHAARSRTLTAQLPGTYGKRESYSYTS